MCCHRDVFNHLLESTGFKMIHGEYRTILDCDNEIDMAGLSPDTGQDASY